MALWCQRSPVLSPNTVDGGISEVRPDGLDEMDARVPAPVLAGLTDQAAAGRLGVQRYGDRRTDRIATSSCRLPSPAKARASS